MSGVLELLRRLCDGTLSREDEARLVATHQHHFRQRLRSLAAAMFPGRDKSDDAITGLGHEAFMWFRDGDLGKGLSAFADAVAQGLEPPTGFLYYWRLSATILFMRRTAPAEQRERARIWRNVRLALQNGDFVSTTIGMTTTWSLPEWTERPPTEPVPIDAIHLDRSNKRGQAVVRAVLEAAQRPLTHSQIVEVVVRHQDFYDPSPPNHPEDVENISDGDEDPGQLVLRREIERMLRKWYADIGELRRKVLIHRGWAEPGKLRSFRDIAPDVGRSAETCRTAEKSTLEELRRLVDQEEAQLAQEILVQILLDDASGEPPEAP